jgi:hypothetical protein
MAKIEVEYIAPMLLKKPRYQSRWLAVICHTEIEVPEIAAKDCPVIIKAVRNPATHDDPECVKTLSWRRGPDGSLVRPARETVGWDRNICKVPAKQGDAFTYRSASECWLHSFSRHGAKFGLVHQRGRKSAHASELEGGTVVESREEEMRQQIMKVFDGAVIVSGDPHLRALEPCLRVSERGGPGGRWGRRLATGPCVTVCDEPPGNEAHFDDWEGAVDFVEATTRHIFRIDRMDQATACAAALKPRWDYQRLANYDPLVSDRLRIDPSYAATGTELQATMAYAVRAANRFHPRVEYRDSLIAAATAAEAKAVAYETTGNGRDDLVEAVEKLGRIDSGFCDLAHRLKSVPDADYIWSRTAPLQP